MIRNARRDAKRRTRVRKKNISLKCRKQNEQHDEITTSIQRVNGEVYVKWKSLQSRETFFPKFPRNAPRRGGENPPVGGVNTPP